MADQQKKKKTAKRRKPDNRAYPARDKHPDRVLRRIIQSSGYLEAEKWAQKHGLTAALNRLNSSGPKKGMPKWIHDKISEATAKQLRVKTGANKGTKYRVGRALRRRLKKEQALVATVPATPLAA